MNALAEKVDTQERAASRSAMYQVLSSAFFYPAGDRLRPCRIEEIPERLRACLVSLPFAVEGAQALVDDLEAALAETSDASLSASFTALFDNCKGRAAVSVYEKDYGNGDAKVVWEEVIRFYEHFGLNFDVKESHDWPDHIGTELEFMHYLTFIEAAAPDGGAAYRQPQGDFLARHLAKWAPRFRIQLESTDCSAPYLPLAKLVEAFIAAEMDYLGRPRETATNWVPMMDGRSDRNVIPIVDLSGSAYDELPY
ncbi:MAG: molecular chaperone TorD family protein [Nitrospira sp.]|nr:molecular chaperone TorD family protein [Nitrospira sp.]